MKDRANQPAPIITIRNLRVEKDGSSILPNFSATIVQGSHVVLKNPSSIGMCVLLDGYHGLCSLSW